MDNQNFEEIKASQQNALSDYISGKRRIAEELGLVFLRISDRPQLKNFYTNEISGIDNETADVNQQSFINSIKALADIYYLCCLFPDERIINHFKDGFGFTDETLKWFISYEEILQNINKLNEEQEFYLDPYCTLLILDSYFFYKIMNIVSSFYIENKKYDKSIQSVIAIELFKIYQNRENRVKAGNFPDKTPIDKFVGNLDMLFQQIIESQDLNTTPKKLLKNIFSGKVEDLLLIQLYKEFTVDLKPQISERKKRMAFFDLLRLVMKDRHWLTKDEWEKLDERRNYPAPYNNYEIYMATTVKKFIQKK